MTRPQKIDVHHHLVPPAFAKAMADKGIKEVAGAPLPVWSAERSLEVMELNGIQTALLSLSAPGVYFGNVDDAIALARRCNECAAETSSTYPESFGFFAVLPMPFTDHACNEAIYALDTLRADGIVLLGSTDGVFLGDARFDELMAELNHRRAIVFVHPNIHATSTTLDLKTPHFIVEFLCDTTRAATNLILSGTMERYPDIRWILSHAGGFLPYSAWRLSLSNAFPEIVERAPQGVLTYIRRFYYDTALSPSPFAMAALRELVDADHILFGSDFPFAPGIVAGMQVKALDDLKIFDAATKQGIGRGHALKLFPRFAQRKEQRLPRSQLRYRPPGALKTAVSRRAVKLVDWLRNR